MNVSFGISRRLQLNSGGSGRTGVVIAVAGVALAVIVMELTLAVVVGFKNEIRRKLMGFDAQLTIHPGYDPDTGAEQPYITLSDALSATVASDLPQAEISLAVRQPGILKTDDDFEGVMFLARSSDGDFSFEKDNIKEGMWPDYTADSCRNNIVLSAAVASKLKLEVGDRVYSVFIIGDAVKTRRNTVAGIYESDFGDYDRTVAYASPAMLQSICGLDSVSGTRVDIRGINTDHISEAAESLQQTLLREASIGILPAYYPVTDIEQTGAMYYNWLALLDTNVVVIFILMLAVAGFTLISSLFILILERVSTIGILRALGASKGFVRNVFVAMSMRVVGLGMLIGNVVGIGIILFQKYTHAIPLDPEMYYLSSVPVEFRPWSLLALNIGVIVAAWLILVVPAGLAAKIDPAGAVKYE